MNRQNKNTEPQSSSNLNVILNGAVNEEESLKALEDSNRSYQQMQAKAKKRKSPKKQYFQQNNNEEDEDEDEDEENEEDEDLSLDDVDIEEEDKKGLISTIKNIASKVGIGSLKALGGSLGVVGSASIALIGIYRVHYNGEFEFKGISGEYQNLSYKYQNYTSFDSTGNVVLNGLTKENKLSKAYYTLYSDDSYYAVVEDSSKYENINDAYKRENLLTAKELKEEYPEIIDIEGREKMFQLNPDVLYSLDRYLHKGEFLYPQQFIKPVYYEESQEKFELKMLQGEDGLIKAKSQLFNSDGTPSLNSDGSLKKDSGIWDYGLASILRYKEFDVKERDVTMLIGAGMTYSGSTIEGNNYVGKFDESKLPSTPKIGESVSSTVTGEEPSAEHPSLSSGTSSERNTDRKAYAIDMAVTAGGTITSNVKQQWQEKEGSRNTTTKKDTMRVTEKVKITLNDDYDEDGKLDEVEIERVHVYEVNYEYETYTEEYVPCYEGDLDTSGIVGSQYYREYIRNYSNYIPHGLPNAIDPSVLENEEVSELFVDDDPNAYGNGTTITTNTNVATEAEFKNAVFMGDSLTVGLGNGVEEATVVAKINYTVTHGLNNLTDEVISKKPPVVVISYGTNDAGWDKIDTFIKDYKELIAKLKAGIPNVKIYINKIFPGDETKPSVNNTGKIIIKNIPKFNTALAQIASESQVTLIDCTSIPNLKNYYNSDGIHFKAEFYKLWHAEMKKKIVNIGSSTTSSSTSSSSSSSNSTSSSDSSSNSSSNVDTGSVTLPPPRPGEERTLIEMFPMIGELKGDKCALKGMKYIDIFKKYGNMYGVDPYLLHAISAQETCSEPNKGAHRTDSGGKGLMQIEHGTDKLTAYNHETKTEDTIYVKSAWYDNSILDPDLNIKAGAMMMAQNMKSKSYNILVGLSSYNPGPGAMNSIIMYYLSEGKITNKKDIDQKAVDAYVAMNHIGWFTATYPGDKKNREGGVYSKYTDPNDGVHRAKTWYTSEGFKNYSDEAHGIDYHTEEILTRYAGESGDPWIMKPDGTVVTLFGGNANISGGNSAISAFNSYLASNWSTILEKKEILYPWTANIDNYFEQAKKGDYKNIPSTDVLVRNTQKFISNLTKTDEDIVLAMMFALNQGNYLSKYDYMSEAEWKAMYNQLLSSPTGKTWDDKWIGFNCEDVFGVHLDDLGTLFKEDAGVNPTISRKFGIVKNIYTEDDATTLSHYNEMNFGIDITIPEDTEVLSIDDGKVIKVSKTNNVLNRYGTFVQIEYNNNVVLTISNLDDVTRGLKQGSIVRKGDVIGTTGGKCKSYKDGDLHVELLYNDELINPEWIITRDLNQFIDPISGNTSSGYGSAIVGVSNIELVNRVIAEARTHMGKPYYWGGTGPNSFDCSGFMYYILKTAGVNAGGRQVAYGYRHRSDMADIPREQIQPGDFVFWHDLTGKRHSPVYHVGIYAGNDEVIDCSPEHKGVGTRKFSSLQDKPGNRYFTVGRLAPLSNS